MPSKRSDDRGDNKVELPSTAGRIDLNTSIALRGSLRGALTELPVTNKEGELSPEERRSFHQKIAMVGYGVYGKAIHSRLSHKYDVLPWERKSTAHPNSDLVTTDLGKALDGRGVIILAVPSNAFPSVLDRIRPHKDTVIISFAKGLIVPNWNPLESERSLREGPPKVAKALTPVEYIRAHPYWKHVADNVVFVGGPGFAKDVQDGGPIGLTIAGMVKSNPGSTDAVATAYDIFTGMSGDRNVQLYTNDTRPALASTALEISASMKNVAAFAAGVILGILKKNGALEIDGEGNYRVTKRVNVSHGDHHAVLDKYTMHRLVDCACSEIVNIVKYEGGRKGGQLTMAGNYDLNLTVNSLTSRNVQAGMRLALGEDIYKVLTTRDANGHLLTAEGVAAIHAMARRIQSNKRIHNNVSISAAAPLVFCMRDILTGRGTPEGKIAQLFGQTKQLDEQEARKILNGTSKPHEVQVFVESPGTTNLN